MNKEITLKKHSAMIQISCKELTIIQRKLINAIIWCIQTNQNAIIYETSLNEVKKMCSIQATDNVNLKHLFKGLRDISIEFNYLNKDKHQIWSSMSFLSAVEIEKETGHVKFEMPEMLKEKIRYPSMYAPLNMILIAGFKCSYTIILYELLRDYLAAHKMPKITIEDYRVLMGIKEHEYKDFKNFRIKVITPAVEELNEKSDLICRYELKKKPSSNKYEFIQFFVSKKKSNTTYEKNEDLKTENSGFNLDLFEDMPTKNDKPVARIPEEVMVAIPDKQNTEAVKEILTGFIEKGNEYLISNIRYSLKKSKDNFPAYLRQALEQDYARHDREVKLKTEKKHKEISRQAEEKEKKVAKDKIELDAIKKMLEELPKKKYDELESEAKKALKLREPGNAFAVNKTSVMIEMANIYKKSHDQVSSYNGEDFE